MTLVEILKAESLRLAGQNIECVRYMKETLNLGHVAFALYDEMKKGNSLEQVLPNYGIKILN